MKNFERSIIFFLLLIISILPCCKPKSSNQAQNTSVQLPQESIEAMDGDGFLVGKNSLHVGMVHEGDTITCKFLFVNQGNEPVKIIEYDVSCQCSAYYIMPYHHLQLRRILNYKRLDSQFIGYPPAFDIHIRLQAIFKGGNQLVGFKSVALPEEFGDQKTTDR